MTLSRHIAQQRRSFVSTVLLSRTWDSQTVVELRKEAKSRGLSTKGNKAALVSRIQEHEQNSVLAPKKTIHVLPVKLPNLSHPPSDNTPVQIPYVPDFWNSARPKPPLETTLPKVHVVSGQYDEGSTYNLDHVDALSPTTQVRSSKELHGIWPDFYESMGLPRSFSVRHTLSDARKLAAQAGNNEFQSSSRPLTAEERRGLYVLFGILGGSWLVGALVDRSPAVAKEVDIRNQH